ncbi:MAG: hypothetical protein PHT02_02610 [Tissierellia bacterium]|nr:hypothetical protein [Tissierellia bacterium]
MKRISKLLFGLILYAFGLVLNIHANIGLAPWDTFNVGISQVTSISIGNASIIVGIIILIIVVALLKEKIGLGTILNTILIGIIMDIMETLNFIPYMNNFFFGILMLLSGQIIVCLATYFYISSGLGCGPRDSLMVALGKKFPSIPIGAIRGTIEGIVLIIGYILGAKVGLGTVIAVFGIGFIMQTTFKLLHFDIRAVVHESIFETTAILKNILLKKQEKAMNK